VWAPGTADTVCTRRPLMTQVQHRDKTAQTDHVTLRPWLLTLECHSACGWCESSSSIRIPSLKFVGLAVRVRMCDSINGPGDLWPFDLETGMRVAYQVGNLHSKFGHARSLGSRIIRCVLNGRIDGWTDKSNVSIAPSRTGGSIIIVT